MMESSEREKQGEGIGWIIEEAGIEYLGGLILRMADVFGNLGEE